MMRTKKTITAQFGPWAMLLGLITCLNGTTALAAFVQGEQLAPVERIRGPYQHTVLGASLLSDEGLPEAGSAALDLPDNSFGHRAWLSWMGTGLTPDRTATFTLADGTVYQVHATDPDTDTGDSGNADAGVMDTDAGVASDDIVDEGNVIRSDTVEDPCLKVVLELEDGSEGGYWSCQVDVTSVIQALNNLDGTYTMSDVDFDISNPPYLSIEGTGDSVDNGLTATGAFSLMLIYSDPEDASPRNLQVLRGLVFAQEAYLNATAPILPFQYAGDGGRFTLVSMGGDKNLPDAGECIPDSDGEASLACDFVDLCPDNCAFGYMATLSSSSNPLGNIFNENTESAGLNNVSNGNALDIDTWPFGDELENEVLYETMRIGVQAGSDAVVLLQAAFEVSDFDTDGDGLSDIQEDINENGEVDEGETDPNNPDSDSDGIPDGVEVNGGLGEETENGVVTDPLDPDTDDDGLCDGSASLAATSEHLGCIGADQDGGEDLNANGIQDEGETRADSEDTDNDGLNDFVEKKNGIYENGKTDPTNPDTDGDTLLDGAEDLNANGITESDESDPTVIDTDGGGESDAVERQTGRDPQDPSDDDIGGVDADSDGLPDSDENIEGTDINNPDTDGDGVLDGAEVSGVNPTDPLDPDSDNDGLCDGNATVRAANNAVICTPGEDMNGNSIIDPSESDPTNPDTDGDGLNDKMEVTTGTSATNPDTDGDGLCDGLGGVQDEQGQFVCGIGEDMNLNGVRDVDETNAREADTDQDGLSDGVERNSNYPGPLGLGNNMTDPLVADTDGDGISDGLEDINGNGRKEETETDPTNIDTDGGGENDGAEAAVGQDPVSNPGDDFGQEGDYVRGDVLDGDDSECDPDLEDCEDEVDYPENTYVGGSAIWSCAGSNQPVNALAPWFLLFLWVLWNRRRTRLKA